MKNLTLFIGLMICCFGFSKCAHESDSYAFFVAGHIYGSPTDSGVHIHPPFKAMFPYIQSQDGMSFGVLTGDMVRKSERRNFDTLVSELKELKLPYFIAPGNHDMGNRALYEEYFGNEANKHKSYSGFTYKGDLFIFLDGNLDKENITGEQLAFFRSIIDQNIPHVGNIFVFVHQLIWITKDNEFKNIVTNWPPNTPDTTNYWSVIEPILVSTNKPVYLFAGDLGANHLATPYMYFKKKNITYLAGGMGHRKQDNIFIVRVDKTGEVDLELVALQDASNALGKIKDYKLP